MVGAREGTGIPEIVRGALGVSGRAAPAWKKALFLALFVLCLDFATKAMAASSYGLGVKDHFLFVSILHMQNPGISLGLFSHFGLIGGNGVQIPAYAYAIPMVFLTKALLEAAARTPRLWIPIGILLGGIFGNVFEMLFHGYATDFIYIPSLEGTANLADFALTFGILFMLLTDLAALFLYLFRKRRKAFAEGAMV
jgi:lipoprotein signal peptidase